MKLVKWSDNDIFDNIRKHIAISDNNGTDKVVLITDKGAKVIQYCRTCEGFVDRKRMLLSLNVKWNLGVKL